jgi:hypothetical protein
VIGAHGAGPIAAAACAIAGSQVDKVVIYTDGFRFANISSYRDPNFLPGIVKYGDLPALVALNSSHDLCIVGESTVDMSVASASFKVSGADFVSREEASSVEWLER